MTATQLDRLYKDSSELKIHADKLFEQGEIELMRKIQAKSKFLDQQISELSQLVAA
jgi:hypothetical protein